MFLLLGLICVLILKLGPVEASLTPDDPLQVAITTTTVADSAIGQCMGNGETVRNVRLQEFVSQNGTTFVRRLVSDKAFYCMDQGKTDLSATSFTACSAEAETQGLKMFHFGDGVCIGYPFSISMEQQGCVGSGTKALYTTLEEASEEKLRSGIGSAPAIRKQQATARITLMQMSDDIIARIDDFNAIEGKALTVEQSYHQVEMTFPCQCHILCEDDPDCNAYSVTELSSDNNLCLLANENVYTNTPSDSESSYYAVKADLVEDDLSLDNLIYRVLDTKEKGFPDQMSACEAIPGFRLVAVRFEEQMEILQGICLEKVPDTPDESCGTQDNWFYVDLIKVDQVPMLHGEYDLSLTTNVVSVISNDVGDTHYIYAHSNSLHDEDTYEWNSKPVCQANVYGVQW